MLTPSRPRARRPATEINFDKCDGKAVARGAVYQVHRSRSEPECFVLGSSDALTWGLSVEGDPSQGVTLTYGGGEICHKRIERQEEKVAEPPPPPLPECNAADAEPAPEVTAACTAHLSAEGGGKNACDADPACAPPLLPALLALGAF